MNTKDLRKHLISEMNGLAAGKIRANRANATARLAGVIVATVRLDRDLAEDMTDVRAVELD